MNYKLETIDYYSLDHECLYQGIAKLTQSINNTYPGYTDWLFNKFFPGLKDGSRKMVIAYNDLHKPMGVALLKDTEEEKKICCLFVQEDCRGNGIANKLMKQSCAVLKTSKPTLTVSDTNLPQLQKLLDKNGFTFSYKKKGAYLQNDTENYFNNEATEILKKNILAPLFAKKLRQK